MFIGVSHACETNEIDVLGDGTQCEISKFEITTTNLSANTEFRFYMSAQGTFYIDCGNGGTLSGTGVSGKTVARTDTTESLYACTYSTGGVKTINFGGMATGYSTRPSSTISFSFVYKENTPHFIKTVSGDLSKIFPYISANAADKAQPRFSQLFYGASNLQSVQGTLFGGYTTAATMMFRFAFAHCSSLTQIPETLFSSITTGAAQLFESTFSRCTGLQSIPANLFSNIRNAAYGEFYMTFGGCAALSGYIPPSLFKGLIENDSPYATNMMHIIFSGTNLATSCPPGTVQYITGYEDYWNGHVSCVDENLVCDAGEYLPAHGYRCETCPENNYCSGGTYPYSETITSGATQCPNNWYSPSGMSSVAQCGRILHLGDDVVYLRNAKKTTPSLTIKVGDDIFYGNMTTNDVVMHNGAAHRLKIRFNNTTYSVYDDTVEP